MNYSPARWALIVFIGLILALIAIEGVRLTRLYWSIKSYKTYWDSRLSQTPQSGDFVYLAMGDSVAQGIGASTPQRGYVGLIAQHIEQTTGRHVHIINISVTGAKTDDVVREQLPKIKNIKPDLITLDVGANDINRGVPAADFQRNFKIILDALPTTNTIVADLPTFERGPKQKTLLALNTVVHSEIASHGFQLAPVYDFTKATLHDWTTYAADFFHPSNKGYRNWYNAFLTKLDGTINSERTEVTVKAP